MDKKDLLPKDGRQVGDYKTRYPECKSKSIRDAIYIVVLMTIALVVIFLNFLEVFEKQILLTEEKQVIFHNTVYCVSSGLLGGATFGMKYFYRVVAHGLWSEDRVFWRIFSPLIAIPLSLVMAAIMFNDINSSGGMAIIIGFFTGYFSDEAVGKMYEIACVLFTKTEKAACKDDTLEDSEYEGNDKDNKRT